MFSMAKGSSGGWAVPEGSGTKVVSRFSNGATVHLTRGGVDDDCGAASAEHGIFVDAQGDLGRDGGNVRFAVFVDRQNEIRNVPSGHRMIMSCAFKVRSRRLEIGGLALAALMEMDGMFAGRQIDNVKNKFDTGGCRGKCRGADSLPLHIDDRCDHRFRC